MTAVALVELVMRRTRSLTLQKPPGRVCGRGASVLNAGPMSGSECPAAALPCPGAWHFSASHPRDGDQLTRRPSRDHQRGQFGVTRAFRASQTPKHAKKSVPTHPPEPSVSIAGMSHPDAEPTVHGIRGHRRRTAAEAEFERKLAERWEREHPINPSVLAELLRGGPSDPVPQ